MKKLFVLVALMFAIVGLFASCTHTHYYAEWETTKLPTCTENGEKVRYCSCGEKQSEILLAIGHNYVDGVCGNCGDENTPDTPVLPDKPVCQHTEVEILAAVEPTCTEAGLTEGKVCAKCEEIVVAQTIIDAFGHTEVVDKAVEPTCTETGLTEGKHCSACGVIMTEQKIVPSLGHSCVDGVCTICDEYVPGLYSEDDKLIASWDSLVNGYGLNVENDNPSMFNPLSNESSLAYILTNNSELSGGAKLMLDKSVTKIGLGAFSSCTTITDIVIPDTVKSIGGGAFYRCTSLKSIVIPDGITEIESDTFAECYFLSDLTIPNGVTKIGNNAFYYCFSWTEIIIPEGVKTIGDGAFQGCSGATSISLPNSLTSIGNWAFQYCDALNTVEISDTVTYIGVSAFANCRALQSITVDEGNTAYKSVSGNLYTKDGKTLMQYAIAKQNKTFTIPDGVTAIDESAFSNATQLISLVIPESLVNVKDFAYNYCSQISEVYYLGNAEKWQSISVGEYNSYLTDATIYYYSETEPTEKGNFWHYVEGVIEIWPEYVEPDYSVGLEYTPNGDGTCYVSGIGTCKDLDIIIPKISPEGHTVTGIGENVFNGNLLTSITIPESINMIELNAFRDCTNIKSVYITNAKTWCEIAFGGYYSNPLFYGGDLYLNGDLVTELVIPDGTSVIEQCAFFNYSKLTSIIIPNSVNSIGTSAFYSCTSLAEVKILGEITSIGDGAFYGCSFTSIYLPEGLTTISTRTFAGCGNLTSVVIPKTLTFVGESSFVNCQKLKYIFYDGTVENWANVLVNNGFGDNQYFVKAIRYYYSETAPTEEGNFWHWVDGVPTVWPEYVAPAYSVGLEYTSNGDGTCYVSGIGNCSDTDIIIPEISPDGLKVTSIGSYAFNSKSTFKSVTIPSGVARIENNAFGYCSALESVVIGSSSIGGAAFVECKALKNITLENTVKEIGQIAFGLCESLTEVDIPDSVTSLGTGVFWCCYNLTTVNLGNGITEITDGLFEECYSLQSIIISNSVTRIGELAFNECSSLTSVQMGSNVETIDSYAFLNCAKLTSITIPEKVSYIGEYAFSGCNSLKNAVFEEMDGWNYTSDPSSNANDKTVYSSLLLNYSTAATCLRSEFVKYFWVRR